MNTDFTIADFDLGKLLRASAPDYGKKPSEDWEKEYSEIHFIHKLRVLGYLTFDEAVTKIRKIAGLA